MARRLADVVREVQFPTTPSTATVKRSSAALPAAVATPTSARAASCSAYRAASTNATSASAAPALLRRREASPRFARMARPSAKRRRTAASLPPRSSACASTRANSSCKASCAASRARASPWKSSAIGRRAAAKAKCFSAKSRPRPTPRGGADFRSRSTPPSSRRCRPRSRPRLRRRTAPPRNSARPLRCRSEQRMFPPERIICLTEETVETLYLLGEERRIVGVSGYAVRPARVRREKPRVSAFISADFEKILAFEPDLVLAFSDLQADIAAELIRRNVAGHAFNQRDIAGILDMIRTLGALVGVAGKADARAHAPAPAAAPAFARARRPCRPRRPARPTCGSCRECRRCRAG